MELIPIVGEKYYRKSGRGDNTTVIEIHSVGDWVKGKVLKRDSKREVHYKCRLKNFNFKPLPADWPPYSFYGACKLFAPIRVLNTRGESLLMCSQKKANWYLKKGFADPIDQNTIQLNNDTTEKTLFRLYGEQLSPFFMEVKNDKCVCCGVTHGLSQHHVFPRRHKPKISEEYKVCLSNILFVCVDCHKQYEDLPEPNVDYSDSYQAILQWKDHFLTTMEPKFIPKGWNIFAKNPKKSPSVALQSS